MRGGGVPCACVALALVAIATSAPLQSMPYSVGVGIADVTGPVEGVNFMGYANPAQKGSGLHTRCYSRAYVIVDESTGARIAFASVDTAMMSQAAKIEVLKRLDDIYGPNVYNETNVAVSGTHTHSAPGGYLQYVLFSIATEGFYKPTLDAMVNGTVESIVAAHENAKPGQILYNEGELDEANINRSPSAYLNNPENERARYPHNTDHSMVQLRFQTANGADVGALNWFAVHCTSMNNTNKLVSSDNKGLASVLFERDMNGPGMVDGSGPFVAAFASTNLGDVSPNVNGTYCLDTGEACDFVTSTCHGRNELCVGRGPGRDMFESTRLIGERQYVKAKALFESATERLSGPVEYRHMFVDMSDVVIEGTDGKNRTCPPAMGYAFAAGTTDGPGAFDFHQSDTSGNKFWNAVVDLIKKPTAAQVTCHHPKPILLDTGEIKVPYAWQPTIVDVQLLRIGQLVILAVPGEFTTMAGRRLRAAVKDTLLAEGMDTEPHVVIAGLSNTYSDYITTFEEYQTQRYEGASTVYGPHTLNAYIQLYRELAQSLMRKSFPPRGPPPPDMTAHQLSLIPKVLQDTVPLGSEFGAVISDVEARAYRVGDVVSAKFRSASPRNDLRRGKTFLAVERQVDGDSTEWQLVATDAHWETKFLWNRPHRLSFHSEATVEWTIPVETPPGHYRLRHFGTAKHLNKLKDFVGTSSTFTVVAAVATA